MSVKFKIEPVPARVYDNRSIRFWVASHYQDITAEELTALASCVQTALSGVRAETKCKCGVTGPTCGKEYRSSGPHIDRCKNDIGDMKCCHHFNCHS